MPARIHQGLLHFQSPNGGGGEIKFWMRILVFLSTLMVTLIVSASLVSQEAATAAFCACINGEELSTAVTASCTEWHGTSLRRGRRGELHDGSWGLAGELGRVHLLRRC